MKLSNIMKAFGKFPIKNEGEKFLITIDFNKTIYFFKRDNDNEITVIFLIKTYSNITPQVSSFKTIKEAVYFCKL